MTDRPRIAVQVSLDAPLSRLRIGLQAILDLAAFSLSVTEHAEPVSIEFKNIILQFQPAQNRRLDFEGARTAFPTWIVGCSLRDAIEVTSTFLEEARMVLAIVQFGTVTLPSEAWNQTVAMTSRPARKFHRAGLPDKLQYLATTYGVDILNQEWASSVRSINVARNCLVHRRGIVGPSDTDDGRALRVEWRGTEIFASTPEGEIIFRKNPIDVVLTGPSSIQLRPNVRRERHFGLGERVQFSVDDLVEILYTLATFAADMTERIIRAAEAKGVSVERRTDTPDAPRVETAQPGGEPLTDGGSPA